jgi:hypothetical protein
LFKVIIYDCDGVLIDSRESNRAFYNHILERFGLGPLTEAQLAVVHVNTAQGAIDFLFQGHPRRSEAQAYQQTINNALFLPLIRLEPHIREVLIRLRSRYLTAIATNRGKSLPLVLRNLGLDDLFDLTVSAYEVTRPKPHQKPRAASPLPPGVPHRSAGGPQTLAVSLYPCFCNPIILLAAIISAFSNSRGLTFSFGGVLNNQTHHSIPMGREEL